MFFFANKSNNFVPLSNKNKNYKFIYYSFGKKAKLFRKPKVLTYLGSRSLLFTLTICCWIGKIWLTKERFVKNFEKILKRLYLFSKWVAFRAVLRLRCSTTTPDRRLLRRCPSTTDPRWWAPSAAETSEAPDTPPSADRVRNGSRPDREVSSTPTRTKFWTRSVFRNSSRKSIPTSSSTRRWRRCSCRSQTTSSNRFLIFYFLFQSTF